MTEIISDSRLYLTWLKA